MTTSFMYCSFEMQVALHREFITLLSVEIQPLVENGPRPAGPAAIATLSRSRRALYELLVAQDGAVTLADLVKLSGLHENTVRGHLEGLEAERLVAREQRPPQGRGRPALLWRARSDQGEYAALASTLAYTLRDASAQPEEDAIGAGKRWGRRLATSRPAGSDRGVVSPVRDLLDDLGFSPVGTVDADAEAADLRLTTCPLLEAAREVPSIVCNVHRGLAIGAMEEYGAAAPGADLVPFAEPGACLLHLRAGAQ